MPVRVALLAAAVMLIASPAASGFPRFDIAGDDATAHDVASTPDGLSLVVWEDKTGLRARTVTPDGTRGPVIEVLAGGGDEASVAYDEQNRRFALAYSVRRAPPAAASTALVLIDPATGTTTQAGEVPRLARIERHGTGYLLVSSAANGIELQRLDASLSPVGDVVTIANSANGYDPALAQDATGQRVLLAWLSAEPAGSLFAQVLDGTTLGASGPPRALAERGDEERIGATDAVAVAWNPRADRWLLGTMPLTSTEYGPEDPFAGSEITRRWAVVGQLVGADLASTPPRRVSNVLQRVDGADVTVDVAVDATSGIGVVNTAGGFLSLRADGTIGRRGHALAPRASDYGDAPRVAITAVPGTGSLLAVMRESGRFFGPDEEVDAFAPAARLSLPRVRSIPARPKLTVRCGEACEFELASVRACIGYERGVSDSCRSPLRRAQVASTAANAARTRHVLTFALTAAQRRALMRRGHGHRVRRACLQINGGVRDPSGNVTRLNAHLVCFRKPRR